jgi:hypothetical protein
MKCRKHWIQKGTFTWSLTGFSLHSSSLLRSSDSPQLSQICPAGVNVGTTCGSHIAQWHVLRMRILRNTRRVLTSRLWEWWRQILRGNQTWSVRGRRKERLFVVKCVKLCLVTCLRYWVVRCCNSSMSVVVMSSKNVSDWFNWKIHANVLGKS